MLNVKLICVGKLKEKFYLEACREYEKRLGGLCRIEIVQLDEEPDRPGSLEKEAERIRAAIPQGSYVIAMCIEGRTMSSEGLADKRQSVHRTGAAPRCASSSARPGGWTTASRQGQICGCPCRP